MAIINCNECTKEISDKATACPHCGAPQAEKISIVACPHCGKENSPDASICPNCKRILATKIFNTSSECPKCGIPYITEQKNAKVNPVLIISLPLFLGGLVVMMSNPIFGLLIIALAFIIDYVGRKKKTVVICPKCRYEPY